MTFIIYAYIIGMALAGLLMWRMISGIGGMEEATKDLHKSTGVHMSAQKLEWWLGALVVAWPVLIWFIVSPRKS